MIIAILCGSPYSTYARDILREMNARGIKGVHIIAAAPARAQGGHSSLLSFPLAVVRGTVRGLRRVIRGGAAVSNGSGELESVVASQGGRLIMVADVNGGECQQVLRELEVDLMVLGGAPIMKAPVLSVPKIGTLNAHQGALPRYRGMNVIEWALLEKRPPTVTVHFVDPGVDTGDIVRVERIPVLPGDTLKSVRERSSALQSRLLADAVLAAVNGPLPRHAQAKEDGVQFYAMHPTLKLVAERHLQGFLHGAM